MSRTMVLILSLAIGFTGLVLLRNDAVPVVVALLMQLPLLWAFAWLRRNPPEDGGGGP